MTIDEAINAEIDEEGDYLVKRHAKGDTSILGWVVGCAGSLLRKKGIEVDYGEITVAARRILDARAGLS